jgi:hypothetical protein
MVQSSGAFFLSRLTRNRVKPQEGVMGTYGLEGVIRAWELEKLTTEQAVGQILQIIVGLEERLRDLEHRQNRMGRLMPTSTLAHWAQDKSDKERET